MEETTDKNELFGVTATNITNKQLSKFTFANNLLMIQSIKFWLITYAISFVVYYVSGVNTDFITTYIPLSSVVYSSFFLILNLLLFPFSVLLFGRFGSSLTRFPIFFYVLIFPSAKIRTYIDGSFKRLIIGLLKLILFYFVWLHSYILGIIGIIILLIDAKNLSK